MRALQNDLILRWKTIKNIFGQWKMSGSSGTTYKVTKRRRQSWGTSNGETPSADFISENLSFQESSHDYLWKSIGLLLSQWNMPGSSGTTHKVIGRRQQSWRSLNWVIGEKQSYQLSLQLSSLTKWETPESPKDDLKKTAVFMHLKRSNWTWLL